MRLFTFGTTRGVAPCILLEEIGVDYELVSVNIDKPDRPASLLAINPLGRIPVLQTDEVVLDQAALILIHLAEKYKKFLPASEPLRTQTLRWLMVTATDVMLEHVAIYRNQRREDGPVSDLLLQHRRRLAGALRECDRQLGGNEFLAGEISIADFALYTVVRQYSESSLNHYAFDNLSRWIKEMSRRPAVQKAEIRCPYNYDVSKTLN